MKKYSILILFLANIIGSGCKKTGEPNTGAINSFKRYPFEHFHITYEFGGDARGLEEVYVSGYGKYEAQYVKSDIFTPGGMNSQNQAIITRIADIYSIDYSQKTVIHNHIGYLDSLYHLDEKDIPPSQEYLEFELKRNALKNAGSDTVAGKLAQRWQLIDGNMTMWTWKGILLRKFAGSAEGSLDMRIKNIDTLWTIDTTKFTIPSGLTEVQQQNPNAPPTN